LPRCVPQLPHWSLGRCWGHQQQKELQSPEARVLLAADAVLPRSCGSVAQAAAEMVLRITAERAIDCIRTAAGER